ncbi:MAG TPA: hypothetical protein DCF63_08265 [Planctomycetaceae bacterium]|nr:hypothetical protein [Planctomycetaceae bacterium]
MEVIPLQSLSSGKCVFASSGDTCVLFEAGISVSKAEFHLAEFGFEIRDCQALVLSHEHSDHISGAGVFHCKFGLPTFANLRTWNATRARPSSGHIGRPNYFRIGFSKLFHCPPCSQTAPLAPSVSGQMERIGSLSFSR